MVSNGRAGSTLRLIGLCCAVLALSACEPSMEEILAQHRAPVEAVFGRIKALEATVQDTPPVIEDRMALGPDRVVLEGEGENALFIRAENLQTPQYASSDAIGASHARMIERCGEVLDGRFRGVKGAAEDFLETCGRAEYVFVMRTHAKEWAKTVDRESFRPGMYEGDVLLFRIADGALLGGFRVSATNSHLVTTRTDASGYVSDASERLDKNLSSNVFAGINEKLRLHVPGSVK